MEGIELHPVVDERGVHRFDPAAVDRAGRAWSRGPTAHRMDELRRTRSERSEQHFSAMDGSTPRCVVGMYRYSLGAENDPARENDKTDEFERHLYTGGALNEMRELAAQVRHDAEMAAHERQQMERIRAYDEQRRRDAQEREDAEIGELEEQLAELLDALSDDDD